MSQYLFRAWLELPYLIGVHYDEVYPATYREGIEFELRMRFRNDLFSIKTSNRWSNSEYHDAKIRELITDPTPEFLYVPHYATGSEIPAIAELVKKHGLPYLHVDQTETVVEIQGELEIPGTEHREADYPLVVSPDLQPSSMFFNNQVLPRIAAAADAYRVATLPAVRYSIHPIAEGIVNSAFFIIQDDSGKTIATVTHKFDLHGHNRFMQDHVERLGVQSRFDVAVKDPKSCQYEMLFCSAYYLFHMRRWTEAVTIASSVADTLVREYVFSKLVKPLADALWSANRTRTDDLFNKILPAIGLPRLADREQSLWKAFKEAKEYRGSAVHGAAGSAFNTAEEKIVHDHLMAFYGVARWLSLQSGRPWALDVVDDGELLPFF